MIVPVTFRLLVKPVDLLDVDAAWASAKKAGLDLSGTEKERKREQNAIDRGTVLAMGPVAFKAYDTPNPLQIGDEVIYARHSGKEVTDPYGDPDEKVILLNDEDIIAIIRKETE